MYSVLDAPRFLSCHGFCVARVSRPVIEAERVNLRSPYHASGMSATVSDSRFYMH